MHNSALYPGTFDPITNGHLDLIERAATIFEELIIAVSISSTKNTLFNLEQRVELASKATTDYANVKVVSFDGLLVDCAKQHNSSVIVRGLRAVSDFEYEFQMAGMNKHLSPKIETLFLAAATQYTFVSSSVIREIAKLNGSVSAFVPKHVELALQQQINKPK